MPCSLGVARPSLRVPTTGNSQFDRVRWLVLWRLNRRPADERWTCVHSPPNGPAPVFCPLLLRAAQQQAFCSSTGRQVSLASSIVNLLRGTLLSAADAQLQLRGQALAIGGCRRHYERLRPATVRPQPGAPSCPRTVTGPPNRLIASPDRDPHVAPPPCAFRSPRTSQGNAL